MGTIFVTAILALPLWEWVSRRWNKNRAYTFGIAFWALVQVLLITLDPASGLSLLLGLCVLAGIGVGAAQQPPNALYGIRILIGPVPAVLLGLGILFAILYPLNRHRHAEITMEIEDRRFRAQ